MVGEQETAVLVYPHQLFPAHPGVTAGRSIVLVEDPLYFRQYAFHRQKLVLHRASMKRWAFDRMAEGHEVHYVEAMRLSHTAEIGPILRDLEVQTAVYVDPSDDWLFRRLESGLRDAGIASQVIEDPDFLTPRDLGQAFCARKKRLFFTEFYIGQRNRLEVLLDEGKPVGGKWSFDTENRKRLPARFPVPYVATPAPDEFVREAQAYVEATFPDAIGDATDFRYPIDHQTAAEWLDDFVTTRLGSFGEFEDAISREHDVLFHSVLTPMLNIGLLSPNQVVEAALRQADAVPINSLEGFIRQVIGWREFVRIVYLNRGRDQRTRNALHFSREVPASFYDGTTGLPPFDSVVKRVLKTGYCHHIERLMVLGNLMLLCEVRPDDVYRWFMELFIDAYDWVMVPNVYGMSQFADGGQMTTKPYLSGSSYLLKMSDYPRGPWCEVWDALFWRFIDRHEAVFRRNPRTSMLVNAKSRLGDRLGQHHRTAEAFLANGCRLPA